MNDVDVAIVHSLIEPKASPGLTEAAGPQVGYGVMRKDLTPKPAYRALARERGVTTACP